MDNNISFSVGSVVVNFGQTAKVVGFWASADGGTDDQTGWPILKAVGPNGKTRGGKWVANPALCKQEGR